MQTGMSQCSDGKVILGHIYKPALFIKGSLAKTLASTKSKN